MEIPIIVKPVTMVTAWTRRIFSRRAIPYVLQARRVTSGLPVFAHTLVG